MHATENGSVWLNVQAVVAVLRTILSSYCTLPNHEAILRHDGSLSPQFALSNCCITTTLDDADRVILVMHNKSRRQILLPSTYGLHLGYTDSSAFYYYLEDCI